MALEEVAVAAGIMPFPGVAQLAGNQLQTAAVAFIKKNSLHGQFIDALPVNELPELAVKLLQRAIQAATGADAGVIQL